MHKSVAKPAQCLLSHCKQAWKPSGKYAHWRHVRCPHFFAVYDIDGEVVGEQALAAELHEEAVQQWNQGGHGRGWQQLELLQLDNPKLRPLTNRENNA